MTATDLAAILVCLLAIGALVATLAMTQRLLATTRQLRAVADRISFRLVRGPVPHVAETFELRQAPEGTAFLYTGELGTDLWGLGRWWGDRVAAVWERTVAQSLDAIQTEAERRANPRPS